MPTRYHGHSIGYRVLPCNSQLRSAIHTKKKRMVEARRTRIGRLVLFATTLLCVTACTSIDTRLRKLPAYSAARSLPAREQPVVFFRAGVDELFPTVIPYALITASGGLQRDRFVAVRDRAHAEAADVVFFEEHEPRHVGEVGIYWGYGVSTSESVYRGTSSGLCCRLASATLGIVTDDTNMVMTLPPEIRQSGIQEGDSLLSVNGIPWSSRADSALWRLYVKLSPGDEVELVWLRPGIGRMAGRARALTNEGRNALGGVSDDE